MIVELAAVRLLQPWFGSSLVVWTNVIAVVLLALALGYLLGGRLSGRGRALERLAWSLGAAGLLTAWLPALSSVVTRIFLPAELALHEAADVVLWGSLAASVCLFLPPAVLLGTVAPLAVEAFQETEHRNAGHAGGAVLSASTLGSLAGVFGSSHVLVPTLGVSRTFHVAAGLLFAAGLLGLLLARRSPVRAGAFLFLVVFAAFSGGRRRPELPEGTRELAHGESSYQSVRILERGEGEGLMRILAVNEGFDSFQSVWQPNLGLLPPGFYYNAFALPGSWSAASHGSSEWEVLVLGLGAGTALRVMDGALPEGLEARYLSIELDPLVVRLSREHLGLEMDEDARKVFDDLDARVALQATTRSFHQVVLDCYANQVEIPAHLCTVEFFREVEARLEEGGWLSANLGGFGFDDPVVASVARTCARAFGDDVLVVRVPQSRNYALFARRAGDVPRSPSELFSDLPDELARVLAPMELPGGMRLVGPDEDGIVLTDDHCPIELLQLRSIAEGRERRMRGEATG